MIFANNRDLGCRVGKLASAVLLMVGLAGCDILDVENPNNLVQQDIENPVTAAALSSGALATVAQGIAYYATPFMVASDELDWIGSRDAWGELNIGIVDNPFNEFTDAFFEFVAEGRWMADEAIAVLEDHSAEGVLPDPLILAEAYLWGAMAYTYIGDFLEDFPLSDRQVAAPPIGEANMSQVYQTAIGYLDQALAIAAGSGELETQILAQRARTKHALAVWQMLNPPGTTPGNPLVAAAAGAAADAGAVVGMVGITSDWRFELGYGPTTIFSEPGWEVNQRLELRFGDRYITPTTDNKRRASTLLQDPIDNVADPAVDGIMDRFEAGGQYPDFVITSAREMHLILAESELAAGNQDGFETHINHVRAMDDGLTPFTGQIDNTEMLVHARMANLYLMGRRLLDLYRFGLQSDNWQAGSTAVSRPGSVMPISAGELESNTCIIDPGSC